MRPGEIRSLTWAAFDKETWTLRLHAKDAKTGHGRAIPLEDELRTIIERRIKARRLDCEFIFHRAGRPVGEFRTTWQTACKQAGLAVTVERDRKKVDRALRLPYDLKRTALRTMARGGTDPAVATKISGRIGDIKPLLGTGPAPGRPPRRPERNPGQAPATRWTTARQATPYSGRLRRSHPRTRTEPARARRVKAS